MGKGPWRPHSLAQASNGIPRLLRAGSLLSAKAVERRREGRGAQGTLPPSVKAAHLKEGKTFPRTPSRCKYLPSEELWGGG